MKRYEAGENITIEAALYAYQYGLATIVMDGKYIQIEREKGDTNETV